MKKIDLIIAVKNEERNLKRLYKSFLELSIEDIKFGLIFIEDGSSDNILKLLRQLSSTDRCVKFYSFSNPYGQGFALFFGVSKSDADAVITINADSSHPFEVIKLMIDEYIKG